MGFTPQAVKAMSLYEFAAASDGYLRSLPGAEEKVDPPSDERFLDYLAGKV